VALDSILAAPLLLVLGTNHFVFSVKEKILSFFKFTEINIFLFPQHLANFDRVLWPMYRPMYRLIPPQNTVSPESLGSSLFTRHAGCGMSGKEAATMQPGVAGYGHFSKSITLLRVL